MAGNRSSQLTGTALLAALVVVLDYALKFSGLKIPFPWMPTLKFDFTGIPIILSLLFYGLPSAMTTSVVAFVAIIARSGDLIGALMKFAAEFATVLGLALGFKLTRMIIPWLKNVSGWSLGILFRVMAMSLANLVILPAFYGIPENVAYGMLPLIALFNVIQGSISVLLGIFLYEAVNKRFPISKA